MSKSLEEKVGLILGKLESQETYISDLSHFIRDEAGRTHHEFDELKERVDSLYGELSDRVDDLEDAKNTLVTIVRTLKGTALFVLAALAYNWEQLLKFFGKDG